MCLICDQDLEYPIIGDGNEWQKSWSVGCKLYSVDWFVGQWCVKGRAIHRFVCAWTIKCLGFSTSSQKPWFAPFLILVKLSIHSGQLDSNRKHLLILLLVFTYFDIVTFFIFNAFAAALLWLECLASYWFVYWTSLWGFSIQKTNTKGVLVSSNCSCCFSVHLFFTHILHISIPAWR